MHLDGMSSLIKSFKLSENMLSHSTIFLESLSFGCDPVHPCTPPFGSRIPEPLIVRDFLHWRSLCTSSSGVTVDEEKKLIELKVVEGDLLELYKDFLATMHVETKDGIDLVTWTFEYEMLNEDVEHPISLLSFVIDVTKDIENHHLGKP